MTCNTSLFPSLLRTLSSLIKFYVENSRSPPVVILGYHGRDLDERSLWGMLENEVGICLEKVGECEGWSESTPIEFWIGQLKSTTHMPRSLISSKNGDKLQVGQLVYTKSRANDAI